MMDGLRKTLSAALVAAVVLQTGCGTIMYPNRRGQRDGRLDAGVAILDGLGLLFFIIPGVIAFAVDISDGAIYLPGTARRPLSANGLKRLKFDPRRADDTQAIERLIRENTGVAIKLDDPAIQVFPLKSVAELPARFAALAGEGVARR
jgi:hypothetical protein